MQHKYPQAQTIFGGDYIDGRADSLGVLNFVRDQVKNQHAIALMGNHEGLLLDALDYTDEDHDVDWLNNGAATTIRSLLGADYPLDYARELIELDPDLMALVEWIRALPYYHITDNFVFVHAGLNLKQGSTEPSLDWSLKSTNQEECIWLRESYWYGNHFRPVFAHNYTQHTIVTGHTPTCLIDGTYDDDRRFTPSPNPICPIIKLSYPHESPRYFCDGGCHADVPTNTGNVAVFNNNSELIDQLN